MIVLPSEAEINKTWQVQVVQPFQKTLATKYPFDTSAHVEASSAEIGQFFGPDGVVAKFVNTSMGPLVTRRGDVIEARTWGDIGLSLSPQVVSGFPGWVAPLSANGVAQSGGGTVFQIQPLPAPGTQEYTLEIEGQQLRYRNTPATWTTMVHPGPQGVSGARISAVTFDGRTVELFNEPGVYAINKMFEVAKRKKTGNVNEMTWSANNISVTINLRVTSSADTNGNGDSTQPSRGFKGLRLPDTIVGHGAPPTTVASLGPGVK
jgi:type VI secretion system protein ImpL